MVSAGTWIQRLRRVNPVVWDSLLAALLFVVTGASVVATAPIEPIWAWTLAALLCAPLALRRRAPLAVLAVVSSMTALIAIVGDAVSAEAALALAVYSAAAHRPWRQVETIALPISVVGALVALLQAQHHGNAVEVLVGLLAWVGFPLLLGRIVFNRRERILNERETATREALSDERARIARELHDVVAHAISVMVVQASAARVVVDHDPAAAKDAIRKVEETGRVGLAEMRRLIGVLTDDATAPSTAPQPGLDQLDPLLATMRDAGLPVEVVRTGTERPLPPGPDLTAYRVIQESLTNVLKHAGPAHARVGVRYLPDRLEIDVEDDGRGGGHPDGIGHGLLGMRERVATFGGTFETSRRPGGGFAVHAEIPIQEWRA